MPRMGRKRTKDKHLPERVYLRHGRYYHASTDGKWRPLAKEGDIAGMHRALAELLENGPGRLSDVIDRYEKEVLTTKAPKTQRDQKKQLAILRRDFGKASPADVKPSHVAAFLDAYPSPVAANRVIALLSHVYKKAIRWGICDVNPCRGVEHNPEDRREVYVTHESFWAAWKDAPPRIQLAMELAYITGQRQADVLGLRWSDCRDDGMHFRQHKTGTAIVVDCGEWGQDILARCKEAQSEALSFYVLANAHGQRLTSSGFQTAWQKFMREREDRFQFRDIRKKSANDGVTGDHLGHRDPRTLQRWYMLKPKHAQGVTGRE